jgi:hypothetical protein
MSELGRHSRDFWPVSQMSAHALTAAEEQTCPSAAWCHKETHAPQQTAALFDHLVGLHENARGNCETEGYSRLLVDD